MICCTNFSHACVVLLEVELMTIIHVRISNLKLACVFVRAFVSLVNDYIESMENVGILLMKSVFSMNLKLGRIFEYG